MGRDTKTFSELRDHAPAFKIFMFTESAGSHKRMNEWVLYEQVKNNI